MPEINSLKEADLSSEAGLQALGSAVVRKIRSTDRLEKRPYYVPFLESFCKDLCANCELKSAAVSVVIIHCVSFVKF